MATTEHKSSLYSKIADVVAEVGYVAKDGKNEFQNYRYTSAEALLATVRGPLSARKVVLMPSLTALSEREYTTSKGKTSIITTAHVSFEFVDGESGETYKCAWAGQGDDPADKGLGKAFTNAIKTFLREQFLIPTGDDPEADPKTDERAGDRAPARTRTTASNGNAAKATPDDVKALLAAAKGLTVKQVKLGFSACGLTPPEPFEGDVFADVPQAKAGALAQALAKVERAT